MNDDADADKYRVFQRPAGLEAAVRARFAVGDTTLLWSGSTVSVEDRLPAARRRAGG